MGTSFVGAVHVFVCHCTYDNLHTFRTSYLYDVSAHGNVSIVRVQ